MRSKITLCSVAFGLLLPFGCSTEDSGSDKRENSSESDPLYGHRFGDDAFRCDSAQALHLVAAETTFDGDITLLIQEHCISCHAAGATSPDLSTYAQVKEVSQVFLEQVNQGLMPPAGPLSTENQALVKSWIDGGHLEKATAGEASQPRTTERCGTIPAAK